MAKYTEHKEKDRAIILVVGDSGAGKTSLFASAANAGYKVRILDTENKLGVLRAHLTPEGAERTSSITFKDDLGKRATGMKEFRNIIYNGWKDGGEDLGPISGWGPDTILGVDSATALAELMKHEALDLNGRKSHEQPTQQEWYDAVRQMTNFLDGITSDYLKCNVVITALPIPIEDELGLTRYYPNLVTKNFSTTAGRYFDNVVRIYTAKGGEKRIKTVSDNRWELKTIASDKLDKEVAADLPLLIKALTA